MAGHSHFGDLSLSAAEEREERRRAKWGEPSLLEQREREERKLWVRAYIEYTALNGPDDLYADALKYLAELDKPQASNSVFAPWGGDEGWCLRSRIFLRISAPRFDCVNLVSFQVAAFLPWFPISPVSEAGSASRYIRRVGDSVSAQPQINPIEHLSGPAEQSA
jgi:hypothetical protein